MAIMYMLLLIVPEQEKKIDMDVALKRLENEGIKLTTAETAIYEILESADAKEFKEILKLIKEE